MARGKKRKLLFLVVRVVVTVGLLGFIYTKIEFRDKVFLKSGDVLEGKLVEWDVTNEVWRQHALRRGRSLRRMWR